MTKYGNKLKTCQSVFVKLMFVTSIFPYIEVLVLLETHDHNKATFFVLSVTKIASLNSLSSYIQNICMLTPI